METRRTFLKAMSAVFITLASGVSTVRTPVTQATVKNILDASPGSLLNCRMAQSGYAGHHAIEELANNIKQRGLLHPIGLSTNGDVLFGFRRLAAIKQLLDKGECPFTDMTAMEYSDNGKSCRTISIDLTNTTIKVD